MVENRCRSTPIIEVPFSPSEARMPQGKVLVKVRGSDFTQQTIYRIDKDQFKIQLDVHRPSNGSPSGAIELYKWTDKCGWEGIHKIFAARMPDLPSSNEIEERTFAPYFTELKRISKDFAFACVILPVNVSNRIIL